MLNFTGSTKKRNVNLGSRKPANRGTSFLEQTKIQRQQREESRARDRAAIVVQRHIRGYLDLAKTAETLLLEIGNSSSSSEKAVKLAFVCEHAARNSTPLAPVLQLITESDDLDNHTAALLYKLANLLLHRKNSGDSYNVIVHSLHLLLEQFGILHSPQKELSGVLSKLHNDHLALECAFSIGSADSLGHFIRFLTTTPALPHNQSYSQKTVDILSHCNVTELLQGTSSNEKLQLLTNVLSLHGNEPHQPEDLNVHAQILSSINFSIALDEESDEDMDEDLQQEEESEKDIVLVPQHTIDLLQVLYSSEYISRIVGQFDGSSLLSSSALQTIAALMHLLPDSKTKLCMRLTITPGSHQRFFKELVEQDIFKQFIEAEKTYDYLLSTQLQSLLKDPSRFVFWNLLYTFEELISYWLIVSNDLESFQDSDSLLLTEVKDFAIFLKIFSLTLIFNTRNSEAESVFGDLRKLKDISLSLLNQLYMKNLRMKFLPENIWKLKHLKYDIDLMILLVLDDEENKDEDMDISDDEDQQNQQYLRRQRHRTVDSSAKLEVLNKVSFFIDFKDRVKVFQSLIESDQQKLDSFNGLDFFLQTIPTRLTANINRNAVLEDAYESFHSTGSNFKNKIQVVFHNDHGPEVGIDGGGITKEFLTSVAMEGFNPSLKYALFKETAANNELYPNNDIYLKASKHIDVEYQKERLLYIRFLGMILGKCLYENVLVDIQFAPFFLKKLGLSHLPAKTSVDDLRFLDTDVYKNLMKLLAMDEKQLQALELNFSIDELVGEKLIKYDLQPPNGESTPVTTLNRLNYIHQMANFKLNQSLYLPTKYFLEGLFCIIQPTWLNMFDPFELQMLLSGGESDININDWKENVGYGGYLEDDITVQYFWQVVEEMTAEERGKLLKFVTSVSKAPLLGFGSLNPKFGLRNSGRQIERLPTASTCVNLLKLPDYQDKRLVKKKLLYAINTNSGFDLS